MLEKFYAVGDLDVCCFLVMVTFVFSCHLIKELMGVGLNTEKPYGYRCREETADNAARGNKSQAAFHLGPSVPTDRCTAFLGGVFFTPPLTPR